MARFYPYLILASINIFFSCSIWDALRELKRLLRFVTILLLLLIVNLSYYLLNDGYVHGHFKNKQVKEAQILFNYLRKKTIKLQIATQLSKDPLLWEKLAALYKLQQQEDLAKAALLESAKLSGAFREKALD